MQEESSSPNPQQQSQQPQTSQKQPEPQAVPEKKSGPPKLKFTELVSGSFKLYLKKPVLFASIFISVMLPAAIINYLIYGGTSSQLESMQTGDFGFLIGIGSLVFLLSIVISFITGLLTFGGVVRATDGIVENRQVSLGDSLSYAFKKIRDYFVLGLRVFWYVSKWALLLVAVFLIIIALMNTFRQSGAISSVDSNTAYAQMIDPGDTPTVISAEDIEGFEGMQLFDESSGLPENLELPEDFHFIIQALGQWSMLFGLLLIPIVIIVFYRTFRSTFSFYILFDQENISSKDALETSLKLTKGMVGRIFWYMFLFTIVVAIISSIILAIANIILGIVAPGTLVFTVLETVLALIQGAIIMPIGTIFVYLFYKGVRGEKGMPEISQPQTPTQQPVV